MYWQCLQKNSQCLFIYRHVWAGYMLPVYVQEAILSHQCLPVYSYRADCILTVNIYRHCPFIYCQQHSQDSACQHIQAVTITSRSCPYLNGPWTVRIQAEKTARIYTVTAKFLYVVGLSNKQQDSSRLVWNSCFRQVGYTLLISKCFTPYFFQNNIPSYVGTCIQYLNHSCLNTGMSIFKRGCPVY